MQTYPLLLKLTLICLDDFYSSLTGQTISREEYAHAKRVWDEAGYRTQEDYVEIYLRLYFELFADVFSHWRPILREKYSLDMVNYVNLLGYAYDAFLLMTRTKLDLVSDPCLARFIESSVRGGEC